MISRIKIDTINCPGFEVNTFNFHYCKSKFFRFILPPSKINDEVTIKTLLKVLKSLVCPELHILGNFHFSKIYWNNPNLAYMRKNFYLDDDNPNSTSISHAFVRFLCANDLYLVVTFPAQASANNLDFCITSKPENIISVYQKEPFGPTCNHSRIEFKLHQTFSMKVKTSSIWNFYRGNYDGLNNFLSGVDWISVFNLPKTSMLFTQSLLTSLG